MPETIYEGLGLTEDWDILNDGKCVRALQSDDCPTVSSSMEARIKQIQEEEMGVSTTPSMYEKKLLMAGFAFAHLINKRKMEALMSREGVGDLVSKIAKQIRTALESGAEPKVVLKGAPSNLIKKLREMGLGEYIDASDSEDDDE